MFIVPGKPVRHTQDHPCRVCGGYPSMPRHRGIRCVGMTGDRYIWCTREELAGNALPDLGTSPLSFRHERYGWCPCGSEHGRGLPNPEFNSYLRLVPPIVEPSNPDELTLRHDVYAYALSLLGLRDDALADLTRRGLSEGDIASVGYRSVPATLPERKQLLAAVVDRFDEEQVRRVPGFVHQNGYLYFLGGRVGDGYAVPYRDERHRITGVQRKSLLDGRYYTARTSRVADIFHVAGPLQPGCDLYVTEGGVKAQVAAVLGNVVTFGVPGQNLFPLHIEAIKRLAPGRVITALDWE
jgi:hypothetical protein